MTAKQPAPHVAGGATPVFGIPWPDGGASADGSAAFQNTAEATEAALVAGKTYVDEIVTVAAVPPDPVNDVPVRDGLLWFVVV